MVITSLLHWNLFKCEGWFTKSLILMESSDVDVHITITRGYEGGFTKAAAKISHPDG